MQKNKNLLRSFSSLARQFRFLKMMEAPVCPQYPYVLQKHKHKRIDPYYWLNKRDNPEVLSHLKKENAYTQEYFKKSQKFIDDLFFELKGRIVEDDESVPYLLNGYWYQSKYETGKEYPIFTRKEDKLDAELSTFLDVNELAKGHAYYNVGGKSISPNNKILVFGEDTQSRRLYTLKVKNLETGEILEDAIPSTTGNAVWAKDSTHIFYVRKDEQTLRSYQIWKHKIGSTYENDVLVYEEKDAEFDCFVYKTKCRSFIVIGSASSTCNEYRYLHADNPHAEPTLFLNRVAKHEYSFTHYNGHFYMLSNHEKTNCGLYRCDALKPQLKDWETIIAPRDEVMLESVEIFKDHLVLVERENGLTNIRIMDWDKSHDHYIKFNDPAYSVGLEINVEFDTNLLRFSYTSLTTPSSIIAYNLDNDSQEVLKTQKVLGDFNANDYTSERIWVDGHDGVKIPVSIVYKKGFEKQARKPLLQYGYGSYGISMDPYFSSVRLSLLNRGFAFAIAHIRGGEDLGRDWYENAKWLTKKNTFHDFISVGKALIEKGYATKDALYAMGGSAGGMLMGAVMNMEPELWSGVIAQVPFVDVVTTMLDDSIPLTTGEYEEWGNPNDKEYYDYMLSYSPYDNIKAANYPPLLITSGYHDSQVQYWEPTKWAAKLRDYKTDANPVLLFTHLEAGHSGVSGRFAQLKDIAMEYAFLFGLENITE